MTDTSNLDDMPDSYKDLLAQLDGETKPTQDDTPKTNKLSIRDKVFRKIVDGAEVAQLTQQELDVVIVKTGAISRLFYKGEYRSGVGSQPTCWSADVRTGTPCPDVPEGNRQNPTCFDCTQNIKGSGGQSSRACKYRQRIAVMLVDSEGQITSQDVYQLDLSGVSVFGRDQKRMSMQGYAKYLNTHQCPLASVITNISFDNTTHLPKLIFTPKRALEKEELSLVAYLQKDANTKALVELNIKPHKELHQDVDNVFGVVTGEGVYKTGN
tara:strand:+ start:464 stop:1267 length:804 start_codon:yes stop_codon:yes gene_type:complete